MLKEGTEGMTQGATDGSRGASDARRRLDDLRGEALNLVQGELIGRRVKAVDDTSGVGVEGIIVDETRDTFVVEKDGKARVRVAKGQHTFEFIEGRRRIKVSGSLIARRPEDRLKLKLRW